MKRAVIACAAAVFLLAGASAQEPKTPADWAAQLGAESLKDRDAASAALLSLGATARDAVHDALDSNDAEVKSRARELWKSLRWLVVPNADADTKKLVAAAEKGEVNQSLWQNFVERHGAESLRLVAEFRAAGGRNERAAPGNAGGADWGEPENAADTPTININHAVPAADYYRAMFTLGLRAVLDNAEPMDVARLVAETDNQDERARLAGLLDELPSQGTPERTALNWMQIEIALWNYQKAYDFGRDFDLHNASHQMVSMCAVAADRGGMAGKIHEAALKEIPAETDPNQLCVKLSFYTGLFTDLRQKQLVEPLFGLAPNGETARADDESLRRLMETLLSGSMSELAVKALHNVQGAEALYMRSAADLQMQNEPAANADWSDAMGALDAVDDAKKKETFYSLGDLMHSWHDERAVFLWQKILSMNPADTVYDANACFRMGEFLEQERQYANAAQFYEKGMAIASKFSSAVMVAAGPNGSFSGDGQQAVRDKIQELKSRAAEQKSLFNSPSTTDGATDGPQ